MMALGKQWVSGTPRLLSGGIVGPIAYCEGCHHPIIDRAICEVIEELGIAKDTILVSGIHCGGAIINVIGIDAVGAAHGRAPDAASAMKRVLQGRPIVFTKQGDGDCIAIGCESLIHAAARGERITVVMANNGNFGTTGGQMAPTTLLGQVTTTTPEGRSEGAGFPIDVPRLLTGITGVVYAARGAVHSPASYQRTKRYLTTAFRKQMDDIGFSFVEILSACPPNWHLTPLECIERIETEVIPAFPLREYKNLDAIEP